MGFSVVLLIGGLVCFAGNLSRKSIENYFIIRGKLLQTIACNVTMSVDVQHLL